MPVDGFRVIFQIWLSLGFLVLTIMSANSVEVTIYDSTKLDLLGWTSYSPGLQSDRLGWREGSYSTSQGDVVRVNMICNIDHSVVNNWVRLPFLARDEANRIYVNMRFTMRKCSGYPDIASVQLCKESFKLLYYEADSDFANATSPSWDENTYRSTDIVAADRLFTDIDNATINDVTRSVVVTRQGIYFAFYDQGACMTLLSVRIYYIICPDLLTNLTVFKRTVTGPDLTSVVQTRAACTSHAAADQSLYALCKADGSWMDLVSDGCRCLQGFQPDVTFTSCTECPLQTYKSQTGNTGCLPCPANSNATRNGTTECQCIDGFSRLAKDGIDASCTNLPDSVTNLVVSYVNQSFVSLTWQPPSDGRRNATGLYYRATCQTCDTSVIYMPKQSGLTSNSVSLSGLKPATIYVVTVYAETGSTPLQTGDRSSANVSFSTTGFVTGEPRIASLYVARIGTDVVDLVWTVVDPGVVLVSAYEVRYLERAANTTLSVSTVFPNATLSNLMPDMVYIFQVRARSTDQWGEFSNPISAKTESRSGTSETSLPVVSSSSNLVAIIAGAATGVIVCVIIIALVVVLVIYRHKRQNAESNSSDCDMLKYINGAHTVGRVPVNKNGSSPPSTVGTDSLHIYSDPYAYEDPSNYSRERICEIEPAAITIESILLKGCFGNTCAGKLSVHGSAEVLIMIETLNENTSEDERIHFLSKAEIIWRFNHANIITLKGVVSKTTPHMIITEFMPNGSLNYFLKENGFRLTVVELVDMMSGIASAMAYLTENNYILRDLSANSILVDANLVCKVASFDMLRYLEVDGIHCDQAESIPLRWSPPEVITQRFFSVASDVWSFAVVMWEMISFGEIPYSSWSDEQVARAVVSGNRLQVHLNCPAVISQLMAKCWAPNPDERPTFSTLVSSLQACKQVPVQLRTSEQPHSLEVTSGIRSSPSGFHPLPVSTTQRYSSLDVSRWLLSQKLASYVPNFHSKGYKNVNQILHLTEIDLDQMGITNPSHKRTLLHAIRCLLNTDVPYTTSSDYFV